MRHPGLDQPVALRQGDARLFQFIRSHQVAAKRLGTCRCDALSGQVSEFLDIVACRLHRNDAAEGAHWHAVLHVAQRGERRRQAVAGAEIDIEGRLGEDEIDLALRDGLFQFRIGQRDEGDRPVVERFGEVIRHGAPLRFGDRLRTERQNGEPDFLSGG